VPEREPRPTRPDARHRRSTLHSRWATRLGRQDAQQRLRHIGRLAAGQHGQIAPGGGEMAVEDAAQRGAAGDHRPPAIEALDEGAQRIAGWLWALIIVAATAGGTRWRRGVCRESRAATRWERLQPRRASPAAAPLQVIAASQRG
jgi:hypothetical protein